MKSWRSFTPDGFSQKEMTIQSTISHVSYQQVFIAYINYHLYDGITHGQHVKTMSNLPHDCRYSRIIAAKIQYTNINVNDRINIYWWDNKYFWFISSEIWLKGTPFFNQSKENLDHCLASWMRWVECRSFKAILVMCSIITTISNSSE